MTSRAFAVSFFLAAIAGCQCGPSAAPCVGVVCAAPLVCDPMTERCVGASGSGGGLANGTGGGGGGGGAMVDEDAGMPCAQTCGGATPLCDGDTGRCVTCTPTRGCSGATPVCQPIANGGQGKCVVCTVNQGCADPTPACDPTVFPNGACVQCTKPDDCPVPGSDCDLTTNRCVPGGMGGGTGGGNGAAQFDDAGMTARCLPFDAGVRACTTECGAGYECVSGVCRLRGSTGPVQVTLRFPDSEDLDLHLVEPLVDGGTCEIYYAMPGINPTPPPIPIPIPIPVRECGAKGWLDVDSNAACDIDNINVENIIYSPGVVPTRGQYIARVVYYQNCGINRPVPWEVEVRANGVTRWYCGQFQPNQSNGGNQGAGVHVTSFVLP